MIRTVGAKRYEFLAKYDPTATEIGHIIMCWALIEGLIDEFIQELAHVDDDELADIIVGNMDFRAKLAALKGLGAKRAQLHKHIAPDWLDTLIRLLDYINNDLRPTRNLIAHAHWFTFGNRSPTLVTKKTKIVRPQAFHRTLETRQRTLMRLPQLRAFSHKLLDVWFDLTHLLWYSMRPYPPSVDEDGQPFPLLTLRRYLREVGHTLRAVHISPKKKRTSGRPSKKTLPPVMAEAS